MKRLFSLVFILFSISTFAQKMPFQGRLLDGGKPYNGTATLDFSITDPSWSETKTDVSVTDGYYSVTLGETTPLPDTLFSLSPEVTLNISVNGQALSPVTLYSPLLPYTGPQGIEVDTLKAYMAEAIGVGAEGKARIATTNNGYDGIMSLTDSLGRTGNFIRTRKAGGYLQLAQQDFTDDSFKSAALMGTSPDQNSYMDLLGGSVANDGIELLVRAYGSNIDLNGPIADGYRRGGIDIKNYHGNFTHNLYSEQNGESTTSYMNLVASQSTGELNYALQLSSGDGLNTGGLINLADVAGIGRISLDGTNGRINSFGPAGSLNVNAGGRGDGDFGYVEMLNSSNQVRAEVGSFGDDSGFLILYGPNGNKNIQIDRDPGNTDLGQINVFGSDGITAQVFASAATDGTNDWGFVNINGPGGIQLDGNSGNITAVSVTQTSDKRAKRNILNLDNSLSNTLRLRGVSYQWEDKTKSQRNQIGVIAQEVEEIYPEFVHTDEEGMKSVNYAQMTAVLIEAIKELNAKVENLENENSSLKASLDEVQTLRKEMDQLMKVLGTSKAASK